MLKRECGIADILDRDVIRDGAARRRCDWEKLHVVGKQDTLGWNYAGPIAPDGGFAGEGAAGPGVADGTAKDALNESSFRAAEFCVPTASAIFGNEDTA